jgi:starch synthase (maltosyl-transferring)
VFGPVFERCIAEAVPGKEEYKGAEKYEVKHWDWNQAGTLKALMSRINKVRKENPALQTTWNLKFHEVDNEYLLFYSKTTPDLSNIILGVVNLDPHHTQSGWVRVPVEELGIDPNRSYLAHDLISNDKYMWQGEKNYVELNPAIIPAHILRIHRKAKRESDFDYFM